MQPLKVAIWYLKDKLWSETHQVISLTTIAHKCTEFEYPTEANPGPIKNFETNLDIKKMEWGKFFGGSYPPPVANSEPSA